MDDVPQFDLYGVLAVPVRATVPEIEAAFRAAAKRDHPDTSPDLAGATRRMQRLNIARDWLTDPDRRFRYDQVRGVASPSATRHSPDIPEVDPLGAWPDHRPQAAGPPAGGSNLGPILTAISLMVLLTSILIGPGSLVVAGVALGSVVVLVYGIMLTILGALR